MTPTAKDASMKVTFGFIFSHFSKNRLAGGFERYKVIIPIGLND
jgi:hypothetical protein